MNNRKCLLELWRTSLGYRLKIMVIGIIGLISIGASLLFVWSCKILVDIATDKSSYSFYLGVALMLLSLFLQRVGWTLQTRMKTLSVVKLQNQLRKTIFVHAMQSQWIGKERFHSGDMVNRMEEDVNLVADSIINTTEESFVAIVQFVAAFVFLCSMDVRLGVVLVLIMPVAILLSKLYMKKMRRMTKEIRKTGSQIQSALQEDLQHRVLIRTLETTDYVVDNVENMQTNLFSQIKQRTRFSLFSRSVVAIGFNVGYAVVFLWSIRGLQKGTVTFGQMTAFLQLVNMVQRPIINLSQQLPSFVHSLTSIERIGELLAVPQEDEIPSIKLESPLGVRLNHLSFAYEANTNEVLKDVSFDFPPNSITALMGETGIGKTTLIRLILALLSPTKGSVNLYNHKQEIPASVATRCNVVYIPQGNTLLSGTIRDNLLLANPYATEEQIQKALHIAVADFVNEFPQGLDTQCGELGNGISEGQAQRIAIARGLLRSGHIIILDEPTSALDQQTEEELLQRMSKLLKNRTVIIITHRKSILSLCTQTLCL